MARSSLLLVLLCASAHSHAQVLCVQCFDQNDSIGIGVGADNLIANGGFENTTCASGCIGVFCPNASSFNCSITDWTCTGGGTLTYACVYDSAQYMVVEKARAAYFGNSYANPCSGTQMGTFPNNDTACIVRSGCEILGLHQNGFPLSGPNYGGVNGLSLSQTVNGLTPGNTYALEFWAGGEYQGWFFDEGIFAVDVGFGKIFLPCKVTHEPPDTGTRYLIQFIAASTSQAITFTNWGHVCGTCTEVVIDDVRLYDPSHLPASATLCVAGVGKDPAPHKQAEVAVVNDLLTVSVDDHAPSMLTVFDMTARKLIDRAFVSSAVIPIGALPGGAYTYRVSCGNTRSQGTFIKE